MSKYGVFSGPYSVKIWENTDQKNLRICTIFPQCSFLMQSSSLRGRQVQVHLINIFSKIIKKNYLNLDKRSNKKFQNPERSFKRLGFFSATSFFQLNVQIISWNLDLYYHSKTVSKFEDYFLRFNFVFFMLIQAYQQWTRKNGEEERLPGLDLTPEQLYFLAFAQVSIDSYLAIHHIHTYAYIHILKNIYEDKNS